MNDEKADADQSLNAEDTRLQPHRQRRAESRHRRPVEREDQDSTAAASPRDSPTRR